MTTILNAMGDVVPDEFKLAVATGAVDGWRVFRKFGMNNDADTGTEDIWPPGTVRVLPTTNTVAAVVSDSAADTNTTGTGAWTVTVEGLDANGKEVEETVNMAGLTPVNTTQVFSRVNRAYNVTAGSGGVNAGNISVSLDSGKLQSYIEAGEGQSHQTQYTVPSDHYLLIDTYIAVPGHLAGSADTVQITGQIKLAGDNTAWRVISDLYLPEAVYINVGTATVIPPSTEMRGQTTVSSTNNETTLIYAGYLVKADIFNTGVYG